MIDVVNLSSYESPRAIEDARLSWIAYGEDNMFFEYLIETYLHSPTHNAAVKSISDQIFGRGLAIVDKDEENPQVEAIKEIIPDKDLKKVVMERKLLGQSVAQVIYTGKGKGRKVKQVKHFPMHTLRPEKCDEYGEINAYYYHPNWAEYKQSDVLKRIPTFGTSKESIELFVFKPYVSGYKYFSPVDYSGALGYAELEQQISNYHLNDISHGFSGGKVVNFNNGIPSAQERELITRKVKDKLTGARGEKVIVAFNDSKETSTEVMDLPLNDAPAHYEWLSNEAGKKILVGHRVTSPMLLGIKEDTGLGNNADEIMTASQLFNSTVIRPFQDEIIEGIEEILALNGIKEKLYFITIQPVEFMEGAENAESKEEKEERTGVEGDSSDDKKKEETNTNLKSDNAEDQFQWLKHLNGVGETEDLEGWEVISAEVDEDETEEDDYESMINKTVNLTAMKPSMMDTEMFKVRYAYVHRSGKKSSSDKKSSRAFCRALEGNSKVYRKEDILKMKGMNTELGHNGQAYSIWLHKGGVNCYHGWERRIYKKRIKTDGTAYSGAGLQGTKKISVNDAIKQGFKSKGQSKRVAEAQIDRADRGHHPNYKG
jgi:hypothetical protein